MRFNFNFISVNISQAYNEWSSSYDSMMNKTRDLELEVQESILCHMRFNHIIELGCGTGKNTLRLLGLCKSLIALDFSERMIDFAKLKLPPNRVEFAVRDVTREWDLNRKADLISCSLILEHVKNIDSIFKKANIQLNPDGHLYIGELHPFKQYKGSKARFEKGGEVLEVESFVHHISEYLQAANNHCFELSEMKEVMDDETKEPRIVAFLFKKKEGIRCEYLPLKHL